MVVLVVMVMMGYVSAMNLVQEEKKVDEYVSAMNLVQEEKEVDDTGSVSLMWGIADTTASVGRVFKYHIPADAFKGDVQSYEVSAGLRHSKLVSVSFWHSAMRPPSTIRQCRTTTD